MDYSLSLPIAQAQGGPSGLLTIGWMVGLFAIMYFLLIRPQQKQAKEHQRLMADLKKGDDVVTQSGILGRIYAVMDKFVVLEIANGVRIRVLKSAVQGKVSIADEAAPAKGEEKKEEK